MPIDFGLIGYPLSHSFSPSYFQKKFEREGIRNQNYSLFELPHLNAEVFQALIDAHPNLLGLNVTIPYKKEIIPLLNEMDETAEKIGSVNTILIQRKKGTKCKTIGYNTDIEGVRESLAILLETSAKPDQALILGSGGSSLTVAFALDELGIPFRIVSRFKKGENYLMWEDLTTNLIETTKLIINTTPLGMFPKERELPPIPLSGIGKNHFIFDLIYRPDPSLLLQKGAQLGAKVLSGSTMLKTQAEFSYKIWSKVF
jgi:shikimate dehydrogenase